MLTKSSTWNELLLRHTHTCKWVAREWNPRASGQLFRWENHANVGFSFEICRYAFFTPPTVRTFTNSALIKISRCLSIDEGLSLQSFDSSLRVCESSIKASTIRRHWGTDKAWRFWANWISLGFIKISVWILGLTVVSGWWGTRTPDPVIKSHLLYQLS